MRNDTISRNAAFVTMSTQTPYPVCLPRARFRLRGRLQTHFTRSVPAAFADSVHAERGEDIGQQATNEESDDDPGIVQ